MTLTNSRQTKIIPVIYYFSTVVFCLVIFLNFIQDGELFSSSAHFYFILIGIFVVMVYIYFAWKYFEYDGGGEVIVFLNRGVILSKFLSYRTKIIEINRDSIAGYEIYNFVIYKRLVISYKRNHKIYSKHCNITILSTKKMNYLSQSLDKLISKNKL